MAEHNLAEHPRLYLTAAEHRESETARRLARRVAGEADDCLDDPRFGELLATHNAHLVRARKMQKRVVTLLAQAVTTGERRYRDSAVAHVDAIGDWEYWSWITWRNGDARPEAIFDLSYGENSATIALAYDLLYDELSPAERARMVDMARRRSLAPFLEVIGRGDAWWLGKPDSNWNTVCAGGAGLLALAMHEELAEAREALPLVEESIAPFMRSLDANDGGWPEGIGYWAYGMRYAFMYLLSHERSLGSPHRLLEADATRRTVEFPLDFCPHGQPCSFGDSNHWSLSPVHYATAQRLRCADVVHSADAAIRAGAFDRDGSTRPDAAEALLLGVSPDDTDAAPVRGAAVRLYHGLGWARLADRWPDPRLYLAIRGGPTGVPHGHLDLLSFHAVVGRERLIENLTPGEYLDTTFGPRRDELFEMRAQSKNAPLIDGVGVVDGARVDPQLLDLNGASAVLLDATAAMGAARGDEQLAEFCGRLFVLFGERAALVLDRIDLRHAGRVETRLHTRAQVRVDGARAHLAGADERLSIAFAANADFGLVASATTPTTPGDDATMLRWHGPADLGEHFVAAALLAPGDVDAAMDVETVQDRLRVAVRIGSWARELELGDRLAPIASR